MKKQATKKPVKKKVKAVVKKTVKTTSTRKTFKAKVAKKPAKKLSKPNKLSKAKKPKNDINAEIDRILACEYGTKTTERKKPISKPKRTRNLSLKELERKIGKMVREAVKQKPKKEKKKKQ